MTRQIYTPSGISQFDLNMRSAHARGLGRDEFSHGTEMNAGLATFPFRTPLEEGRPSPEQGREQCK